MAALAAVAITFMSATADAQTRVNPNRSADVLNQQVLDVLQARTVTAPPAPPVVATSAPTMRDNLGVYVGVGLGSNFRDATDYQVGGLLGFQLNRNWAAELTYDYIQLNNHTSGQMVMGNVVYGRQVGQTAFTPYALVGAGIGWDAVLGSRDTGSNPALYNVGGGVRVRVIPNVELDARYRFVGAFNDSVDDISNVVTLGVNYRF